MGVWADTFNSVGSGLGGTLWIALLVGGAIVLGFLIIAGLLWWYFAKKRWNIKAEIKLVRSGGNLTSAEWGKARFDAKKGVCIIKRPKQWFGVPIKVFDIRKYIQGDDIVTFVQLGPEDFRPVLNRSWEEYESDKVMRTPEGKIVRDEDGNKVYEKCAMLNIKVDTGLNKAWRAAWNQAAKQAYSLKSFFTQFQTPIAIAIVLLACFVGFAIIWTRLGSIC